MIFPTYEFGVESSVTALRFNHVLCACDCYWSNINSEAQTFPTFPLWFQDCGSQCRYPITYYSLCLNAGRRFKILHGVGVRGSGYKGTTATISHPAAW